MKFLSGTFIHRGLIGGMIILLLFGCASINEMNIGQKYENSKSWVKEKWRAAGSKFSSSKNEEPTISAYDKDPNYLVYRTQWSYETLSGIAEWFTGDPGNWKTLATANPEVRPNRIPEGSMILIPAELVKIKTLPTEAFAAQNRVQYFEHEVRWRGETLSLIAKWYTGRYGNWKALARANPNLNPDRIVIGDIIYIPPEMMKTQKRLPQKVAAKSLPNYFSHTVQQSEEKLTDIAEWYTGKAENAELLAKANPDIDPEVLMVGSEIFIPSNLLKNRKPYNQKSIQISASEPAKKPAASKSPAPAPKEKKKIQLFGPKQFPAN